MKKTAILASALFFAAAVNAQTEPQAPATTQPATTQTANTDKYNNWHDSTYKLKPMPDALTKEKIFPVIGKYQLTNETGTATEVTISLDESNKGLVWVEGLPEGKFKAQLRKSPSTYRILPQKLEDEKNLPEGVMIYDKDANTMNICLGCKYEIEDPAVAFAAPAATDAETQKDVEKATAKTAKKSSKAKVEKVKITKYSGVKVIEAPQQAVVAPVSQ